MPADFFSILQGVFVTLVVVFFVVLIHEAGHYLVARILNIKIETFSIGFGNSVYEKTDVRGTLWKLCWIPLGGYVQMGEEYENDYHALHLGKKILIALGGPFLNIITGIVVFIFYNWLSFYFSLNLLEVVHFSQKDVDFFLEKNDLIISSYVDETKKSDSNAGKMLLIRRGEVLSIQYNPSLFRELRDNNDIILQKVGRDKLKNKLNLFTRFAKNSFLFLAGYMIRFYPEIFLKIKEIILNPGRQKTELIGPVGLVKISIDRISLIDSESQIYEYLMFFLFLFFNLSIGIALFNLLPILPLDGGQVLINFLYLFLSRNFVGFIKNVILCLGLFILLFLFISITFRDVVLFL